MGKKTDDYQQRRRWKELKEIWWGVNKAAAWAGGWTVICNMAVRKRTIWESNLKTVKHQNEQQNVFKTYLSNKLKWYWSEDNKQKWSSLKA